MEARVKVRELERVSEGISRQALGTLKYNAATDGILCVDCGNLGHITTNCMGMKLSSAEQDVLRNIVFSPKYVNSKVPCGLLLLTAYRPPTEAQEE